MDTDDGGMMNPGTRNDHIWRVRRVSEFICNNLDGELALDKLSREAHFSPFHFHRIFNAVVGGSVMAHIRRLRLERAARHLKKTRRPGSGSPWMPVMKPRKPFAVLSKP